MTEQNLSFGQRIDPENGLVECWFTHGALDWIKKQDWSNKNIIMYGGGMGNDWLAARCKSLVVIERDERWVKNSGNYTCIHRPCNDSSGMDEYYLEFPKNFIPDIIISDDAYRSEAVFMAIKHFQSLKGLGYILICDNYNQSYIWRSPSALEALETFEKLIFEQPEHEDYNKEEEPDGKWKTAIIFIK